MGGMGKDKEIIIENIEIPAAGQEAAPIRKKWDPDENMGDINPAHKKIILVDDVNLHLVSTKNRLKDRYTVYPAQSAETLFAILGHVAADLILLDINMPDCDGFTVIRRLKADPGHAAIPVIFLTAENDKRTALMALSLGAADFVTKPYGDDELIECIEMQLYPGRKNPDPPVILAVDDNASVLAAINQALHDDYKVYTLPDPAALKEILKRLTPDLFILDWMMPKIQGHELVPLIRRTPPHEATPIVFLTAEGTPGNIFIASALGAQDFIVKPVSATVLREKIAPHLKDFHVRRRIRGLD